MSTWAGMIGAGIASWVKKGAASLGLGIITYAGFSALESQIAGYVASAWSGLPAEAYQLLALGGFVDMVGITLGAISAAIGLLTLKRIGVLQS